MECNVLVTSQTVGFLMSLDTICAFFYPYTSISPFVYLNQQVGGSHELILQKSVTK